MILYPALLSDSTRVLQEELNLVKKVAQISTVQIDIIDGFFADNITITPTDIVLLDFGRLKYDIHLMTVEPLDYIYELISECNKQTIRTCIAQVEKLSYQMSYLEEVRKHHWQAGLSLDLFTPLSAIDDASWSQLHVLQLMAIEAGVQGSTFRPQILKKIRQAQELIAKLDHKVELIIDGGIHSQQLSQLHRQGITSIAVGSALWTAKNFVETADNFLKG